MIGTLCLLECKSKQDDKSPVDGFKVICKDGRWEVLDK